MTEFILNRKTVKTDVPSGTILLDFIRYQEHLKGTKAGCREGDCGACTVLAGTLENGKVNYKTVTSCLTPLANIAGKHVVTIEGINTDDLTPVQEAMHENAATQCGFCTPGFVMSFTAYSISGKEINKEGAINSVSGNICRCTGYKSIEKVAEDIVENLKNLPKNPTFQDFIDRKFLPEYFNEIPERLSKINMNTVSHEDNISLGGGTDLYVQKSDAIEDLSVKTYSTNDDLKKIRLENNIVTVGSAVTAGEMTESDIFLKIFPKINDYFKLISSEQIRNVGTIAGNFVNASPIGDLSIFFLALNSKLVIVNNNNVSRKIFLKDFYKSYKIVDLQKNEYIKEIEFTVPSNFYFNFEKVSKRKYLDIASVNSAISLSVENNIIKEINISAGGLAAVPVYFTKTREFLLEKRISSETIIAANEILQSEVTPMSDIRGSIEYKRLLLRQLFFAHFIELFNIEINLPQQI